MSKIYTLAVGDEVRVPVKVKIADKSGTEKDFKFSLQCKRLGAEATIEAFNAVSAYDFLMANTNDWQGQRLILDDDGKPAEFCEDAFKALLDISGMLMVCFNAYVKASNAVEKT